MNIELSGGTCYYENIEDDLLELKEKYNLEFLCHNYFPPAKEPFVINLASLNDTVYHKSVEHAENALRLSLRLGAKKYGIHAGFFLDMGTNEIGNSLSHKEMFDRERCIERFCEGFNYLKGLSDNIELYIENNTILEGSLKMYNGENPFMLTNYSELQRLSELLDFKFLLDVGHLKVSAAAQNFDFKEEFNKMICVSDYIHISDNDGRRDSHQTLSADSNLVKMLEEYSLDDKIVTLETHGDMNNVKKSFDIIHKKAVVF